MVTYSYVFSAIDPHTILEDRVGICRADIDIVTEHTIFSNGQRAPFARGEMSSAEECSFLSHMYSIAGVFDRKVHSMKLCTIFDYDCVVRAPEREAATLHNYIFSYPDTVIRPCVLYFGRGQQCSLPHTYPGMRVPKPEA